MNVKNKNYRVLFFLEKADFNQCDIIAGSRILAWYSQLARFY